jgi:energy-coupling factor transporter ATP-binding protein EcfA2
MTLPIKNLAIGGYRSFGKSIQYFENFKKVNLFIGRNNSGKSNILRFISEIITKYPAKKNYDLDLLVYHLPDRPNPIIGYGENIKDLKNRLLFEVSKPEAFMPDLRFEVEITINRIINLMNFINDNSIFWSYKSIPNIDIPNELLYNSLQKIPDGEIYSLWSKITRQSNGSRQQHWEPELIKLFELEHIPIHNVVTIPAIRQIGKKGSTSDGYEGLGIIERLARLQNPDVHSQIDKQRFNEITQFVKSVIDSPDASIEIPHDRETIQIHMDDKVLPIESLGTGIYEVIILASAATVLNDYVICVEEPEIHLNPILQKKFLKYLIDHTSNQYFISTHSVPFMDVKGVEIYHVRLKDSASVVERVTSDNHRSSICEDLGYHPSDLLQANCVIWVEGPSDRIYLNYWIQRMNPDFVEGIHYSIMFYGGRLAAHLTNDDLSEIVDDLISLRRLNRRGVIIIDSDRSRKGARNNDTKQRLRKEFDSGPGHAWITDGREIENYIPQDQLRKAINSESKNSTILSCFDKYDNCLTIRSKKGKEGQASKVDVARYVTEHFDPNFEINDLKTQINKLLAFIKSSNP